MSQKGLSTHSTAKVIVEEVQGRYPFVSEVIAFR
jgi:hypothetical protein